MVINLYSFPNFIIIQKTFTSITSVYVDLNGIQHKRIILWQLAPGKKLKNSEPRNNANILVLWLSTTALENTTGIQQSRYNTRIFHVICKLSALNDDWSIFSYLLQKFFQIFIRILISELTKQNFSRHILCCKGRYFAAPNAVKHSIKTYVIIQSGHASNEQTY